MEAQMRSKKALLLDVQAHYTTGVDPSLVEGGQLLAVKIPQSV
jgi:hypothetical protein